jgi:phosphoglycerol transferase MdoB-like AlkP superfamily enzyme
MKQEEQAAQSKITEFIGIKYEPNKDAIWLGETQDALRNTVGILGICLPVFLYFGLWIDTGHNMPLESISHYYFTRVGSVFVMIVSLLAFFLIIYKGTREVEFWVSLIAGFCALALVVFPTGNINELSECTVGHRFAENGLKQRDLRVTFHLISAGLFLGLLGVMSVWLFTKPKYGAHISKKKLRNTIYIVCGVLMLAFIFIILLCMLTGLDETNFYRHNKITFWMESLAVWCFGISWMVKGSLVKKITG